MNNDASARPTRSLAPLLARFGILLALYSIAVVSTVLRGYGPFDDPILLLVYLAIGLLFFPLGIGQAIDPTIAAPRQPGRGTDLLLLFLLWGIYASLGVSIVVLRKKSLRLILFLAFLLLLVINFAGCQPYFIDIFGA